MYVRKFLVRDSHTYILTDKTTTRGPSGPKTKKKQDHKPTRSARDASNNVNERI